MNSKKTILMLILGIISISTILLIIVYVSFKIVQLDEPNIVLQNVYNWSGVLIVLVSIMNLVLLFKFNKDHDISRLNEQKMQVKLYWYRSVIIEKNINSLEEIFKESKKSLSELQSIVSNSAISQDQLSIKIKEMISTFTIMKMKIDTGMTDIIKVIEPEFGIAIEQHFMELQDIYTNDLCKVSIDRDQANFINFERKISDKRNDIFKSLFSYEIGLIK